MKLPIPVRQVIADPLDEAASHRMWREVDRRRARSSHAPAFRGRLVWACAAMLAFVGLVIAWRVPRPPSEPGPLHLAGGGALVFPSPPDGGAGEMAVLDDGSHIAMSAGARLRVFENSGKLVTLLLEGGHTHFEVTPGGPRRWIIECGLVSVEVVGTRFDVERAPDRARVRVDEGVVLVRGDRVPNHVQRLVAGEFIEVTSEASAASAAATVSASESAPTPAASAPAASVSAAPSATPPRGWQQLVAERAYKEAYSALGRTGIAEEARRASLDELMLLADVARLSGHPADAVVPLARVVAEHPGDPRAGMAAFTLGRLHLDQLGGPAAAAADFERALALGLPGGLQEDARARIVEARARAGDRAGARRAAADYERLFPNGRRLAAVRSWASDAE